jgi:hypothetical protein
MLSSLKLWIALCLWIGFFFLVLVEAQQYYVAPRVLWHISYIIIELFLERRCEMKLLKPFPIQYFCQPHTPQLLFILGEKEVGGLLVIILQF